MKVKFPCGVDPIELTNPAATVGEIKKELENIMGPAQFQVLTHRFKALPDDKTLEQCNVPKDATVMATVALGTPTNRITVDGSILDAYAEFGGSFETYLCGSGPNFRDLQHTAVVLQGVEGVGPDKRCLPAFRMEMKKGISRTWYIAITATTWRPDKKTKDTAIERTNTPNWTLAHILSAACNAGKQLGVYKWLSRNCITLANIFRGLLSTQPEGEAQNFGWHIERTIAESDCARTARRKDTKLRTQQHVGAAGAGVGAVLLPAAAIGGQIALQVAANGDGKAGLIGLIAVVAGVIIVGTGVAINAAVKRHKEKWRLLHLRFATRHVYEIRVMGFNFGRKVCLVHPGGRKERLRHLESKSPNFYEAVKNASTQLVETGVSHLADQQIAVVEPNDRLGYKANRDRRNVWTEDETLALSKSIKQFAPDVAWLTDRHWGELGQKIANAYNNTPKTTPRTAKQLRIHWRTQQAPWAGGMYGVVEEDCCFFERGLNRVYSLRFIFQSPGT